MRFARFRVVGGNFDGAREATVVIDRGASTLTVRPLRRRTAHTLPLSFVAELVLWRCIKAEVAERKRQKALARRRGPQRK